MIEFIALPLSSPVVYTRFESEYKNEYISSEQSDIISLINEIKKISNYEIDNYETEKIDDEMTVLGIKFYNLPENINKTAFAVELMNKLDDKLPENIDILII